MATPLKFAGLLLLSTALTTTAAFAQDAPAPAAGGNAAAPAANAAGAAPEEAQEEAPDVSIPGTIVVTGRKNANIERSSTAVVSVLSAAEIARTGEGNIAGALARVTGLSVVGSGFVYVRGLGDRYSLALLNGAPLPSPEPLKRVVPLDLFPTNIVSSSLVQKSYSTNFPGEFGGGVINLTTNAVPKESFFNVNLGIGMNTETTGRFGYDYAGNDLDWTGFDNGSRNTPPALAAYWASRKHITDLDSDANSKLAGQLVSPRFAVVQRVKYIAPNWSATLSGGTAVELGDDLTLGIIATAGYSNKWQTRDAIQQRSEAEDLSLLASDFERVTTENRIVVNGLVGIGLEFGDNKIRWTNLYIRDTLKNTRLGLGHKDETVADIMQQDTAWFERQLMDTQVVGEFKITPDIGLDLRGSYANSQREAPNELSIQYSRSNNPSLPLGAYFTNPLNNADGYAKIRYSDLNEDLWSGGADLTVKPLDGVNLSAGYAYTNTHRISTRREYLFRAPSDFPDGVNLLRPDLLLSTEVINQFNVELIDTDPNAPAFSARLVTHAGYGKLNWQATPEILIDAGVRFEHAKQSVDPIHVFTTPGSATSTFLQKNYWLPAATITWQFQPEMQLRVNASQTIARPQFRELIFQQYFDPDTNRTFFGNPLLKDSKLFNAEARLEWYFAREQRVSLAGFYKKIDNPIEAYTRSQSGDFVTGYANAPKADLYGAEFEVQKYFDLSHMAESGFFSSRRLVTIANYTYTKSKLKVGAGDTTEIYGAGVPVQLASVYFRDGAPLTGQSDHLVNVQLGLEDLDNLSQQTFILSYASDRVTTRSLGGTVSLPDIYERPGFTLDFVARQGLKLFRKEFELKFEARNLTNRIYREQQTNGTNTVIYNRYKPGTTISASIQAKF
ncbi:MAG: TonB-dependent receptor [Sphingobium sp.]|nr:TonB-dependent receptor [Sphingobium sp.]